MFHERAQNKDSFASRALALGETFPVIRMLLGHIPMTSLVPETGKTATGPFASVRVSSGIAEISCVISRYSIVRAFGAIARRLSGGTDTSTRAYPVVTHTHYI